MKDTGTCAINNFKRYFSVDLALSDKQKKDSQRIRYNVYCEELGYEPADKFPDLLEFDEFDDRSLHCLITHRASQNPAGCVRMIQAGRGMTRDPLPVEKYCFSGLEEEARALLAENRQDVCEISRLAIDTSFRRRPGEKRSQLGSCQALNVGDDERRTFSLLAEAAFLASIAMARVSGKEYMFAMMEPFLPRMLRRSGIYFHQVGDELRYRGLRAPYMASLSSVEKNLKPNLRELFYGICENFEGKDNVLPVWA